MAGRTHVIIGDGLSAAEFAARARVGPGDALCVIGPGVAQLGRGLAYGQAPEDRPWRDAYLLNSPSEGVDPKFAAWTAAQWHGIAARMAGVRPDWLAAGADYIAAADYGALNAPRAIYGDFLVARARAALDRHAKRGVRVERIAARVTALEQPPGGFRVALDTGRALLADRVDVAPGGPEPQPLFDADGETRFGRLYGNEDAIAARLRRGGALICLGANAAMLDALRLCQSVLPDGRVRLVAVSPSGRLPEPVLPTRPRGRAALRIAGPFDSAAALATALRAEIARARAEGNAMAAIRGPFKAELQRIGLRALVPDQAEARRVMPMLDRLFLRGTRDSLADFHRLLAAGQVRLIAGRMVACATDAGGVRVTVEGQGGARAEPVGAALVNCAGPGPMPRHDPLSEAMLARGWLGRCKVTGGIEVGPGLGAGPRGLRYVSPAVTVIGGQPLAFSLYDAADLTAAIAAAGP